MPFTVQQKVIGQLGQLEDLNEVAVQNTNVKLAFDVKVDHVVDVVAQEGYILFIYESVNAELI